jgi:hypothetical protein
MACIERILEKNKLLENLERFAFMINVRRD